MVSTRRARSPSGCRRRSLGIEGDARAEAVRAGRRWGGPMLTFALNDKYDRACASYGGGTTTAAIYIPVSFTRYLIQQYIPGTWFSFHVLVSRLLRSPYHAKNKMKCVFLQCACIRICIWLQDFKAEVTNSRGKRAHL